MTSGTTVTVTRPWRSKMPKTGILPRAPRPRMPRRWPPKYDSSASDSARSSARLLLGQNGPAQCGVDAQRRRIAHPRLDGGLVRRDFQLEELEQPEPRHEPHPRLPEPGPGEVSERVATRATAVAPLAQAIRPRPRPQLEQCRHGLPQRRQRTCAYATRSLRISRSKDWIDMAPP